MKSFPLFFCIPVKEKEWRKSPLSTLLEGAADYRRDLCLTDSLLRVAINLSKNKLNSAWFKHTDTLEESYPCADLDSNLAFVWDAVRALPSKYREPIHLFYHEGYSTTEIARILGQKESTVRSLLHRGRSMLKETLKEAYDFDE